MPTTTPAPQVPGSPTRWHECRQRCGCWFTDRHRPRASGEPPTSVDLVPTACLSNDVPFSGEPAASGASILHRMLAAGSSAATAGWTAHNLRTRAPEPAGRRLWFREVKSQAPRSLIAAPASRIFALSPSPRRTRDRRPPPSEPSNTKRQSVQRYGVQRRRASAVRCNALLAGARGLVVNCEKK